MLHNAKRDLLAIANFLVTPNIVFHTHDGRPFYAAVIAA